MLGYDLEGKKGQFFNFRHTGASHIAQRGKTPAHLLAVVKMMGDTSVATVNKHYFNIELDLMQEMVLGWERPDVPVPSSASPTVFGVEQTPICDVPLASPARHPAPLHLQDQHAMKPRRSAHTPEIREATNGGEQVMPSRLLSALHRHPKLSRPRRRAAAAPQSPAVEAQPVPAAPDSIAPVAPAAATPKPRRTRTPSCVKVASRSPLHIDARR